MERDSARCFFVCVKLSTYSLTECLIFRRRRHLSSDRQSKQPLPLHCRSLLRFLSHSRPRGPAMSIRSMCALSYLWLVRSFHEQSIDNMKKPVSGLKESTK